MSGQRASRQPWPSAAQVHSPVHSSCARTCAGACAGLWRCSSLAGKPRLAALFSAIPCPPHTSTTLQNPHLPFEQCNKGTKRNKGSIVHSNNQRAHTSFSPAYQTASTALTAAPHGNCTSRHSGSATLRSRRRLACASMCTCLSLVNANSAPPIVGVNFVSALASAFGVSRRALEPNGGCT